MNFDNDPVHYDLYDIYPPKEVPVRRPAPSPVPAPAAVCEECWGTGHVKGFGAPCPRGCASR